MCQIELKVEGLQPCLIASERPLSDAVPSLVPLTVLKVGWSKSSKECHTFIAFQIEQGLECGSEGHPIAIIHGEISDVLIFAVEAPYKVVVLIVHGGPEEPVSGGHDNVVELLDLGRPVGIRFIQVEVVEASEHRAIGISIMSLHQIWRPDVGQGEVVGGVEIAPGLVIRCGR